MTRTLLSASLLLLASAAATAGERPYPEGKAPTIANAERAFPALSAIYMFSGARSNSMDSNTGTQTSVHCFNASNVARQVRFLVRDFAGTVSDDNTISIPRLATRTYSTAATALYFEDITGTLLGTLSQGSIVVQSTGATVFCNAAIVDASSATPNGITLTGVRLNAAPRTME